ncbi:MAG TPA: efflux RND transporter periplasmic adaptor subunit [Thermoanaerobaculia bacterium]|nr:efflux RND transporter periplasmic adaptor subunit [Thermoanaerobaculia bacterium]
MSTEKPSLEGLRIDRAEDRGSGGRGRWIVLGLLVLAAALGIYFWLSRPRAIEVETAAAVEVPSGSVAAVLNASGYVTARRQATVSSKITGKVIEVLVEEGMAVTEGQVLARLDPATVDREVALGEAQLAATRRALDETEVRRKEAEVNRRRARQLFDQAVGSQADADAADAAADSLAARLASQREDVKVAERQLSLRRQDREDTVIRAPFSGVAISKDAQPGEMISPVSAGGGFTRTGVCTVVDMKSLEIEIDVNESYINRVKPGQKAEAALDAYPDWKIPATVITTIPAADREKATVRVRVGFDQLDPRILPDMGVKVAFLGDGGGAAEASEAAAKPRVRVPKAALRGTSGERVVWVVANGRTERRAVKVASDQADPVEVLSGLSSGERVVVAGPADLAEGVAVVEAKDKK